MRAVAAFSYATDKDRVEALQEYQQAVTLMQSAVKSTEDLISDASFLTHFLLLIHEVQSYPFSYFIYLQLHQIATAEESHWHQHLSTLLQITSLRRQIYGSERYPYMVWWLCTMDLEALFAGAPNSGEFVDTMLKSDLVPPPSYHLYPLGADGSSVVYGNELETIPVVLQLDYDVTTIAMRLALLARELRSSPGSNNRARAGGDARIRHVQVYELQECLRELWAQPSVGYIAQHVGRLPTRSKQLFEHAQTLYRACIIYSHTSMWRGQRLETSPDYDTEIAVASSQILGTASRMLERAGGLDTRFLVFPIFIAGMASPEGAQKMLAADLLERMERKAIGRNTVATRKGLERVYEVQNERFMTTGQSLDVDWWDVVKGGGALIVNFGL